MVFILKRSPGVGFFQWNQCMIEYNIVIEYPWYGVSIVITSEKDDRN